MFFYTVWDGTPKAGLMAIKLSKAEYDALPDSLKTKFTAAGDDFEMIEEDVEGLKKSKAEILAEKKRLQDERDELAKFKAEKESEAAKAAELDLEKKGEYEKLLAEKEKAYQERLEAATQKNEQIMSRLHREQLKSELTKRGALPERVDYLANDLVAVTEFELSDDGYTIKKKGGIGDAAEFDAMVAEAKASKGFFFAASNASGSGASGSNGGGNAKTITRTQYEAAPLQFASQLAKGELTVVD